MNTLITGEPPNWNLSNTLYYNPYVPNPWENQITPVPNNSGYVTVTGISTPAACPYCSGNNQMIWHSGKCPKVKAYKYHKDGSIKEVVFHDGV